MLNIIQIIIVAISLSADATAVSICKGLSFNKLTNKKILTVTLYFSIAQALMPIIGYFIGYSLKKYIVSIDWFVFSIFLIIGINMLKNIKNNNINDNIDFITMFPLSIATSIDVLVIGISFSVLNVNIFLSSFIIGIITFILCTLGLIVGNKFGNKYEKTAQLLGALILILLSLNILIKKII